MTDQITYLPASALRESPFNPRKHYDQADLLDLAESIKAQGILQPIVVRPLPDAQTDTFVRYELVFGHRRFRAASALPAYRDDELRLPCILRDMSDEEAALAQVAENLQRKDVTALEEADSFVHLHRSHGMPADRIAERVGKSRSYVYGRLKLAAACSEVRMAVAEQGLSPEIALEVARLRGDKVQRLALAKMRAGSDGWCSYRFAKQALRELFTIRISAAPFDTADATLGKIAGACTSCSRLAGNDPDLAGMLDADVCTDGDCYSSKVATHALHEIARLKAAGRKVITGDEAAALFPSPHASWMKDYTRADDLRLGSGDLTVADALPRLTEAGVLIPTAVYVQHPRTQALVACYADADVDALQDAWEELERAGQGGGGASTPSAAGASAGQGGRTAQSRPDPTADWTPAERVFLDTRAVVRICQAALRGVLAQPRTADDLRMVLMREVTLAGEMDSGMTTLMGLYAERRAAEDAADEANEAFGDVDWWRTRLATLTADQLAALLVGHALCDELCSLNWSAPRASATRMVALAERYGVDVLAAAQPDQMDNAGDAGGPPADAGASNGELFGEAA